MISIETQNSIFFYFVSSRTISTLVTLAQFICINNSQYCYAVRLNWDESVITERTKRRRVLLRHWPGYVWVPNRNIMRPIEKQWSIHEASKRCARASINSPIPCAPIDTRHQHFINITPNNARSHQTFNNPALSFLRAHSLHSYIIYNHLTWSTFTIVNCALNSNQFPTPTALFKNSNILFYPWKAPAKM